MFKLVILCIFVAAAAAKPGVQILEPITHYSYLTPASTIISKQDSSVIHPSPLFYQAPYNYGYAHLIKKRSPQIPLTYTSPSVYYPNYYPTYNTPLIYSSPIQAAPIAAVQPAVHLIKKRSADLIPSTYYAPNVYTSSYSSPLLPSTYTANIPIYRHASLIPQPLSYAHLIKKRSAPLLTTYVAPTSYSHESRFDLKSTHYPYNTITYTSPISYSAPLAYSHLYK